MSTHLLPINVVVSRTGLSVHVLRVWEKRYGAVEPTRTATQRRFYSEAQVERLLLLREITQAGQNIGSVATLPDDELRRVAASFSVQRLKANSIASKVSSPGGEHGAGEEDKAAAFIEACREAVQALNGHALEASLKEAETRLGAQGMLLRVAAPLAQLIGTLWREGIITAAHEHFASSVLRTYLGQAARTFAPGSSAPVLTVATPAGQLHELGALLVAALAANLGWRVSYLGASLPAPEIAGAARQNQARAVALSLVYPEDDPQLESELLRLRELLPPSVQLIVGGRALGAYQAALRKSQALQVGDLSELSKTLDALRRYTHSS